MKKALLMALLVLGSGSLAACDQKVSQQVVIDKSLLEVLQGKSGPKESGTPTTTPSAKPNPTPTPKDDDPVVEVNVSDEQAIRAVIQANADALNSQNLPAYSATLHPDSQITAYMPNVFYVLVQYQTRYRINDLEVEELNGGNASVWVQRSTADLSGTIEQDIIYTLRKSGSNWKIFFMEDENSSDF